MKRLIIFPLQKELAAFLQGCVQRGYTYETTQIGKLLAIQLPNLGITLACGGLGKAQFALQTQHLLDVGGSWDLVICTGAAGALANHLSVGDVVVATATVEHDIHNNFGEPIVPRFDSAATAVTELRRAAQNIKTFSIHFGPVASGDEDVVDSERRRHIQELTGAYAVAWEGAGGARACQFSNVPYIEIRGITDAADGEAAASFEINLANLMDNLAHMIIGWAKEMEQAVVQ